MRKSSSAIGGIISFSKADNLFFSWVGLGVFMGILAGGLVKDENDVTDLVKNLVTKEEGEPLPSL